MDRLYSDITEQFKSFERRMFFLIGRHETLSNLISYLIDKNIVNRLHRNTLKKMMFDLNDITTVFNKY